MFRRQRPDEPTQPETVNVVNPDLAEPEKHGPLSPEEFEPERVRDLCFSVLEKRIGKEMADAMREDFDAHLEKDGIEQAYVCLFGKLVNAIDRAMQLVVHGEI